MRLDKSAESRIIEVTDFESLVGYLRDELQWPIEETDIEELTFDYAPEELGFSEEMALKIRSIKQIRPLVTNQPWGIFYLDFEPKRLPVGALRRLLRSLVIKKRGAGDGTQAAWDLNDLLFISFQGNAENRSVAFAHFEEREDSQPHLRTFYWDRQETNFFPILESLQSLSWASYHGEKTLADEWLKRWSSAFRTGHRQVIKDAATLSKELAAVAIRIRGHVSDLLAAEDPKVGPLHRLFGSFRRALLHDLTPERFADVLAQTFAYGLLAAKAEMGNDASLQPGHLAENIPTTNPLLKELFEEFQSLTGVGLEKLDTDLGDLGVDQLVDLLNNVDVEETLKNFGRTTMSGQEDPVVHFYEEFLKAYDKAQKVERGVFYTPKPVVSFIVRSVHELLQREFGLEDGLASTATWNEMVVKHEGLAKPAGIQGNEPFVQILDPAVGTGTFLEACVQVIYDTMAARWSRERKDVNVEWNRYVPEHLLPRLHGYELMMAPYVVCHMKLAMRLRTLGYDFQSGERLRVYLTNALEPALEKQSAIVGLVGAVAHEAHAAAADKQEKRFTVIIGNPPYSIHSKNQDSFTTDLIRHRYYPNDVRQENNPKSLQDDYVRFFALTETVATDSIASVVGLITNNSYLDNILFRRFRSSLATSFDSLRLLNLNGSSHERNYQAKSEPDENVFDIRQGVATFLAFRIQANQDCMIKYGTLHGTRARKYDTLNKNSALGLCLEDVYFEGPHFAFSPALTLAEYSKWPSLEDAFQVFSTGMKSHRDDFAVAFKLDELQQRFTQFCDPSITDDTLAKDFALTDTGAWTLSEARRKFPLKEALLALAPCDFRPFDQRQCAFHSRIIDRPKRETNGHLKNSENIGLVFARQVSGAGGFSHIFICKRILDNRFFYSTKGAAYVAPLNLYNDPNSGLFTESTSNLREEFMMQIGISSIQPPINLPNSCIEWIYAIGFSPTYRTRYADQLCQSFPRIPPMRGFAFERTLRDLGAKLIALHLLGEPESSKAPNRYQGRQAPVVGKPLFNATKVQIDVSGHCLFENVSYEVWSFLIGGYQPAQKWLKDRKGRTLTKEEIRHYEKVLYAIEETIRIMAEIDQVIEAHGGWPEAFTKPKEGGGS